MNFAAKHSFGRTGKPMSAPALQRGVSLIEVLVAVVVLGIGLLGTAALQATALRGGQSSYESSMAVAQANSIIEAMRANRSGNYTRAMSCSIPSATGSRAERDLRQWMIDLKMSVGGQQLANVASDTTTCAAIGPSCPTDCEITVQWDDSRAGGLPNRQVVTRTRI